MNASSVIECERREDVITVVIQQGKRSGTDIKNSLGKWNTVKETLCFVNLLQCVNQMFLLPQGVVMPFDLPHTMSTLLLIKAEQRSLARWQSAVMQPDVSSDKTRLCLTAMKWVIKACLSKLIYCTPFISMSQTPLICQMWYSEQVFSSWCLQWDTLVSLVRTRGSQEDSHLVGWRVMTNLRYLSLPLWYHYWNTICHHYIILYAINVRALIMLRFRLSCLTGAIK